MVRAGIREAHPAGIWSDGSTDGPVIGTLICVLDRAKNLPNKKKIGKQDPYAVARLAKVAKRTDTDIRGGQVPKWDKELRFPVRDSPDYKTLKISVFNDDKKVDLIGEVSIRLDKILVKGGGTDDGWRVLKCKEKYSGDILVELTFYDLRPKDEPVKEKKAPPPPPPKVKEETGPRRPGGAREMGSKHTTRNRRPLPENPPKSSRHATEEKKATRRSRHSEVPTSGHRHSNSQPDLAQQRTARSRRSRHELRHSTSRVFERSSNEMVMNSYGYDQGPNDMYDPYEDQYDQRNDYDPRYDMRREEEYDDYGRPDPRARPPPPPMHYHSAPVIHQENFPGGPPPPMQHSLSSGPVEVYQNDMQRQQTVRHFRSVPSFAHPDSRNGYDPRYGDPQMDVYGSSVPDIGYGYQAPMQEPMQQAMQQYGLPPPPPHQMQPMQQPVPPSHQVVLQRQISHRDLSMGYPSDLPPMNDHDAPPPPPPPHRHANRAGSEPSTFNNPEPQSFNAPIPAPEPVLDEPNWDNHRPKSIAEEHGLPSYESVTKPAAPVTSTALVRRGSFCPPDDMAHNGIPLPPSLVPGLDPVVAEQLTDHMDEQRRRMSIYEGGGQVATRQPPSNYHRPQVEEVQDVQLYQSTLPPESQVVQLEIAQQQQQQQQQHAMRQQQLPPSSQPRGLPMPLNPLPQYTELPDTSALPPPLPIIQPLRTKTVPMDIPPRKPLPPPTPDPIIGDSPFDPDSYNIINPAPAAAAEAMQAASAPIIVPGSNRVLDPTDILPVHTHAPEPERRVPRAPPPVPVQHRRERIGRSLSPIPPPKGTRLTIEPSSFSSSPPKQVSFDAQTVKKDRNKLRKSVKASQSMATLPPPPPPVSQRSARDRYSMNDAYGIVVYDPNSSRERERQYHRDQAERDARALVPVQANQYQNQSRDMSTRRRQSSGLELGSYRGPRAMGSMMGRDRGGGFGGGFGGGGGGNVGYYNAPAVPPKVPIAAAAVGGDEAWRLSQEMSLIKIGAGDGGRSYRGRR
ncbi:hypothetical protein EX30DRAFT_366010 [Ascodesmis nigricans]|uniref:C2 domain-containing protein n=1 Tax=Ascodesmis nigricans TaxID=341454 RepID=A0A4S2MMP7_9PEZI|nr:hypothetical protein EX30DRAFT_366010 [Ascodesmis nigricans]